MNKSDHKITSWLWNRQAPLTMLGILLLGVVVNALYDLLVKPGLTGFGRLCLDIVTLGSKTIQDAIYSAAALNPTAVTSLYILLFLGSLITFIPVALVMISSVRSEGLIKRLEDDIDDEQKDIESLKAEINQAKNEIKNSVKKLNTLKRIFWVTLVILVIVNIVAYLAHAQSVLVWRVFHANLAIISPTIKEQENKQLLASFASMRSRNEYQIIQKQINSIAVANKIHIYDIETW